MLAFFFSIYFLPKSNYMDVDCKSVYVLRSERRWINSDLDVSKRRPRTDACTPEPCIMNNMSAVVGVSGVPV